MTISDYRPSSLITRVEQAIASGRSLDWMLEHLGADPSIVDAAMRRMDAAVRDDETAYLAIATAAIPASNEWDEGTVRAYMSGALAGHRSLGGAPNPSRVEAIRRLAVERHLNDTRIGVLLGTSLDAIGLVRRRHGIPNGAARDTGPSWHALRAGPRAKRTRAA